MQGPQDLQQRSHPSFWKWCVRRSVPRGCYPAGMCVCAGVCALVSLDVSVWVSSLQRRLIRPWEYPMWQHIRTSLSCFWRPPTHYCNTRTVHSALVHSASPGGRWDNASLGLQQAEREKRNKYRKRLLWAWKRMTPKDHCDIMTKLWLEGSNDARWR